MILASQSPRRIELMREAGYDIRVIPADIDETPFDDEAPLTLVERSGRTHQVATGVCIVRAGDATAPQDAESLSFVDVTDVTFYELTDEQIERYVASGEPMDKAGAYGIQGVGGRMLVQDISGDFYNVVGLPIARVARAIQKLS